MDYKLFPGYTGWSLCQRWTNAPATQVRVPSLAKAVSMAIFSAHGESPDTQRSWMLPSSVTLLTPSRFESSVHLTFPSTQAHNCSGPASPVHGGEPSLEATGTLQTQLSHAQLLHHTWHQFVGLIRNRKDNVLFGLFCLSSH